ncbi:unnamed protein product [Hyaloperonospora brassicae]|uniref:RxLR effector candidate protein n=1 Tax=Hyaloperonospora brassicae TaxID=162125 RepID=A0AAV0V0U1_HYABA|nr:unnamed protein product [Hyaloperonospora brassicae]
MTRRKRTAVYALGALWTAVAVAMHARVSGASVRRRLLSFNETPRATLGVAGRREVAAVGPDTGHRARATLLDCDTLQRRDRGDETVDQEPETSDEPRDPKKKKKRKWTKKKKTTTAKVGTLRRGCAVAASTAVQRTQVETAEHREVGAEAAVDGVEREMGAQTATPLPMADGPHVPVAVRAPPVTVSLTGPKEAVPPVVPLHDGDVGPLHLERRVATAGTTEPPVQNDVATSATLRRSGTRERRAGEGTANTATAAAATGLALVPDPVVTSLPEESSVEHRRPIAPTAETGGSIVSLGGNALAGATPALLDARNTTLTRSVPREGKSASPGQVHASSSADLELSDSSKIADTGSLDTLPSWDRDRDKVAEASSRREEYSIANGARNSESALVKEPGDHKAGNSDKGRAESEMENDPGSHNGEDGGSSSSDRGAVLDPGGVSDVNTSAATFYSLDTGSIVAVVCVIASIFGLLVLFAVIGRKNYTDEDDESPLPYGYNMAMHSVHRLSPTFLEDDLSMDDGYSDTTLMARVPSHQFDSASSTSGESSDEVPSLRGDMVAANHRDGLGDKSVRTRVLSRHSINGDVRMSALYSTGSSMTSSSGISGSWSSVLASDMEYSTTRDTRDTSLSAWSAADSSFGSTASGASGTHGMGGSFSAETHHAAGRTRSCSSSRVADYSLNPDQMGARPSDSSSIVDSADV